MRTVCVLLICLCVFDDVSFACHGEVGRSGRLTFSQETTHQGYEESREVRSRTCIDIEFESIIPRTSVALAKMVNE